ncbi:MAG: helix-turn-helix domain-containing protein [Sedimentibacter sp.]
MGNKTRSNHLLSYPLIVLAASGDVDAINAVLKHYEGYIAALSTRQLYDESGNSHFCVDEALRRRLETKLITKILTFNAA